MKNSTNQLLIKSLTLVVMFCLLLGTAFAQNPEKGFSFQGYARDFDGAAYSSAAITAQFSIYPEGTATIVYTEVQNFTTDPYGVFSAVIGTEAANDFAAVDFSAENYFMKVEVKVTGGDYVTIYDGELQAVPYAKAADRANNGTPAGTVISFAGASAPAGYLVCDGSTVASAAYPELYAAIGTLWGGDATNFNLPDLRGQFLRGQDNGAGVDPDVAGRTKIDGTTVVGDVVGSIQVDVYGSHNHSPAVQNIDHGGPTYLGSGNTAFSGSGGAAFGTGGTPFSTAHAGGTETRPKNAYVLFMIKY
jgi:microcystin-dependent protein